MDLLPSQALSLGGCKPAPGLGLRAMGLVGSKAVFLPRQPPSLSGVFWASPAMPPHSCSDPTLLKSHCPSSPHPVLLTPTVLTQPLHHGPQSCLFLTL
jgi:hypothetical protein